MNKDLRQFLQVVRGTGADNYVEIKKPLKPHLEVCVLQKKLTQNGRYPVVYCPEIEGSKLPLVTNLFGSYYLSALAFDIDPQKVKADDILHEYKRREKDLKPPEVISASESPVKEVILQGGEVDTSLLPIPHHCELDSGKYITIGCMVCKDPDTGIPNAGVYRHEVKGKDQLGAWISKGQHAAYIARRYAELGRPMEVVLFIGHHPAAIMATLTRGSIDVNELEVAGALLGEPLRVTKGETVDLPVPADAEIAIEGLIDPRNMVTDGPFAEYPGYYGQANQPCFLIKITAITMRKDAIYHDLHPSEPEHTIAGVWGKMSVVYDMVKRAVPTVQAVNLPQSGRHTYHVYVSIKQRVPGEAKYAGLAALNANYMPRVVVVVDDDIDVFNEEEVLWAIATRVVADRDVSIISGAMCDMLDPTNYDENRMNRDSMHTKVIIDATKPVSLPFVTRVMPPKALFDSMRIEDYLK